MTDTIDYRTMTGAEFRREVGTDPEKWAEALLQRAAPFKDVSSHEKQVAYLATWFADAIEAGRQDSIKTVVG